jgi:S-adenosylmethionine:tRNA ribosyltransferase-isomerase
VPRSAAGSISFELPDSLAAGEPPEARGLSRDEVRLMTVDRGTGLVSHSRFRSLPTLLKAGDCLVCNASRTLPAALRATARGTDRALTIRLARRLGSRTYSVLLLDDTETPWNAAPRGTTLELGGSLSARITDRDHDNPRLWRIRFSEEGSALMEALSRLGQPVRYWYVSKPWDLDYYQTVYAREPGSMEMPSAGRAFTWRLLTELRQGGVELAFIVLHAGLSSYMDPVVDAVRPPAEEPFSISDEAAEKINSARAMGGRVVAVGTTVVRALESAADTRRRESSAYRGAESAAYRGAVVAQESSTRLHIDAGYRLLAVDGLITGFHQPASSHLDLLSAFLSKQQLVAAYDEALRARYYWHEFGDLALIL